MKTNKDISITPIWHDVPKDHLCQIFSLTPTRAGMYSIDCTDAILQR